MVKHEQHPGVGNGYMGPYIKTKLVLWMHSTRIRSLAVEGGEKNTSTVLTAHNALY
jgi:hypothetical protein